jgi:hypothetical protein
MNKKKINIILIPVVILLWIFVIIRVLGHIKREPANTLSDPINFQHSDTLLSKDTLTLFLDYNDPFISKNESRSIPGIINPVSEKKIIKKVVSWPAITYLGTVQNEKKVKKMALLLLSGKTIVLEKGKPVDGIEIFKLFNDSIKLTFDHESKTFKKQR